MSFTSSLLHDRQPFVDRRAIDQATPDAESQPWQEPPVEPFVLAPGLAWRLLKSLFRAEGEEQNLQDDLAQLIQR